MLTKETCACDSPGVIDSDWIERYCYHHYSAIVANHELLGAIDPLFPPTRGSVIQPGSSEVGPKWPLSSPNRGQMYF